MLKQGCVGTPYHQWSTYDMITMAYAKWDKQVQALHDQRAEKEKYVMAMNQYKKDLEVQHINIGMGVSTSPCYPSAPVKSAPVQKRAKKMYDCDYDCGGELTETQQTKNHLINRLENVAGERSVELHKAYGLKDDDRPKTPREFLDRITGGKFVISEENMNKKIYYFEDAVRWRDPAVKRDEEGFELASKKLRDAQTDATDEIMVKTPEQGLEILKTFKTATFN